ncbi:DnaJ domain-containing protein [Waterburya agarophytonicola K14]|uniref:DnaJ domain-containing protein n=1 Tax=Waterburya agarophytonicola KI4 TaxID=2874699 RepID=A0A964FEE4_9CYAN|nr:DnaJ domain-containing protein [Waterburya agarophytonicola]MCC0176545.1 DnaJ domain-containing protein [Waterburya agarophytonicola KI4]
MNNVAQSYAILEISPTASPELTKQAYRKLAKIWHPDRYVNDPILKAKAEAKIKTINLAYAAIKADLAKKDSNAVKLNTVTNSAPHTSQTRVENTQQTPEFYYQQGMSYLNSEDYDAALDSFSRVIKLDLNYIEAYQCRGFILSKLGYNLRADAEFKKAHQIKLKNRTTTSYNKKYTPEGYSDRGYTVKATANNQSSTPLKFWHTIIGFERAIQFLAVSCDGQIASASNDKEINLWQVNTGKRISVLKGHTDNVTCLAMSVSGRTLISGSKDKTIRFWDLQERKIIRTFGGYFDGHLSEVVALALTPDNQTLISCGGDNSLKIWDVNRGMEIQNISVFAAVTCLALSPDGRLFCTGGLEPELRIRNAKTGQVIRSINNNSGILSLAFSPDGNLLATGGFNRHIKLWDLTTGQEIYTLMGHTDRVSQVIFSQDGKTLISSSWDKTIKLWKLSTGEEITSVEAHAAKINSMALAPNNQTIASGSADNTIKLWQCNL